MLVRNGFVVFIVIGFIVIKIYFWFIFSNFLNCNISKGVKKRSKKK